MGLLGVQCVISMMMASIISKLGTRLSLARYLLCGTGLIRFLSPTDDELRKLAGISKYMGGKGKKGKAKSHDYKNPNSFRVPKDLDVKLDSAKIRPGEVIHLRFYNEYKEVFDYTVCATIVYFVTELYYFYLQPKGETNLSVYWCLLTLLWCIKVLASVTKVYFKGDEVMWERAFLLCMGGVYLLLAMMALMVDEKNLETGLDSAYNSFHVHAAKFLKAQGLSSTLASKLTIKFVIAVFSAVLGVLFTFPGLRINQMFSDSLRYCEGRVVVKALLNVTFAFPLFLTILWIRPLGRELFTQPFGGSASALMSEASFESMRIGLISLMVLLRIATMPIFLQSFLNVAQDNLINGKKEAGRILNNDLKLKVAGVFYYLCIVAVQYVAPCLICLHSSFMYKTLGDGSWVGDLLPCPEYSNGTTPAFKPFFPKTDDVLSAAKHLTNAKASLKVVFNATVFRGIFGYLTFWCNFLLITSSGVGCLYLNYGNRA